jgi:RND family efflux transporter MFP subunit
MAMRHDLALLIFAIGALAIAADGAWAQSLDNSFDCVIQPRAVIKIGSPAEGILREIGVRRGDVVEADQVLARLDSSIEEAEVAIARARAEDTSQVEASRTRLDYESSRLERVTALFERNVMTAEKFEEAQIQHQLAELALRSAEMAHHIATLELRRARALVDMRTVRSPVEGVVVETIMSPGEYAYAQSPILTLAEIDPLHVKVFVPLALYDEIFLGSSAEVTPVEPVGGVYAAEVRVVDRVHDPASGTFGLLLLLDNPGYHLPAGIRCSVRFGAPAE